MKELNLHDLTPALMKELEQLNSADEIVSFFKEKGFAASQEISERIYNKLHDIKNIAEDQLSSSLFLICSVSTGAVTLIRTMFLFSSFAVSWHSIHP